MRVEEVVADVFNLDPAELTDASSKDTITEWDSMGHLSLITTIEDRFRISLATADAMDMTSIAKIKDILKQYGVPA